MKRLTYLYSGKYFTHRNDMQYAILSIIGILLIVIMTPSAALCDACKFIRINSLKILSTLL